MYRKFWLFGTPWLCGTAVERRSLASELSLSCARPVADGWPLMLVSHLQMSTNQANSAFHPFGVDKWAVKLQLDVCCLSCGGTIWWMLTKERQAWCCLQVKLCDPCLSASRVCVHTKMALYKYSSFPSFPWNPYFHSFQNRRPLLIFGMGWSWGFQGWYADWPW